MEPRHQTQPWPSGSAPVPAWTKTIRGDVYTIKRIDGDTFGIWREAEELGTFELRLDGANELRARGVERLSNEARRAVHELVATYFEDLEGPAKRDA